MKRMSDATFFDGATCYQEGVDPDLFFPDTRATDAMWQAQVEAAKAVCARCPVIEECLDRALADPHQIGIQAGLTGNARDRIKRKRRLA